MARFGAFLVRGSAHAVADCPCPRLFRSGGTAKGQPCDEEYERQSFDHMSYSCRRAMIGSTRMARRAGTRHPRTAAVVSSSEAAANETGSVGETWTKSDVKARVAASAAAIPTANPIAS